MPTKNNVFAQEYLIKFLYANTAFPQKDTTDVFFSRTFTIHKAAGKGKELLPTTFIYFADT